MHKKILIALVAALSLNAHPARANGFEIGAAVLGGVILGSVINSAVRPYGQVYGQSYGYGYDGYNYIYGPAPVYVRQPQVIVVQQAPSRTLSYYCPPLNGFYPYVQSCPGAWQIY